MYKLVPSKLRIYPYDKNINRACNSRKDSMLGFFSINATNTAYCKGSTIIQYKSHQKENHKLYTTNIWL